MRVKSIFRQTFAITAVFACLLGNADERQDYITSWSLSLGSTAPAISAMDERETLRSFENMKLEHGLLLFFNRSADW